MKEKLTELEEQQLQNGQVLNETLSMYSCALQ